MQKNVAGQKWVVFAFGGAGHASEGQPIAGDLAQITAEISQDGATSAAIDDASPIEIEDGYYAFDISQAECNADLLALLPESSTANVEVIGVPGAIYTTPPNFVALGIESDGDVTKCNLVATTTTNTDMVGTDAAALASALATVDTEVGQIKAVTDVLPDAGALDDLALILADTGTDGVVLSAAQMNKIADHIIRRTWANAEASSDGDTVAFRSLMGAIAKLVNKVAISGANLEIMRDDDSTVLGTQALTTDAAADPITALDTA